MTKDLFAGILMLVISIAYYYGATRIHIGFAFDPVGADGLPKAIAWTMGGLSLVLIAQALFAIYKGRAERLPGGPQERRKHRLAIGVLVIGAGYVLILEHLGYLLSLTLLIGIMAWFAGARRDWRLPVIAFAGAAVFWLMFWALSINQASGLWSSLF